jgi:hypothetical protein
LTLGSLPLRGVSKNNHCHWTGLAATLRYLYHRGEDLHRL